MIDETTAVLKKHGFYLMLTQNRSGSQAWTALALGDNVEMGPNGALYTRASGCGKTANAAMQALIDNLEKPKPKKKTVEDIFG